MIDNAFIWIDGSPGSGKTLLIERVLQSNRSKNIGVVRFRKYPKSFDECIDEVLVQTANTLDTMPPITILRLAPGFEGLIKAGAVVVNIRDQRERKSAERLLEYIDEVGTGPNRIEPTFGYFWRPKKSMFVCNLSDPKDLELRKLVAMIKRRFVER